MIFIQKLVCFGRYTEHTNVWYADHTCGMYCILLCLVCITCHALWYVLHTTSMISIPNIGMLSVSTKTYQFLDEYHTSFLTVHLC